MEHGTLPLREFLRMLAADFPAAAIDWSAFPVGPGGFLFDVSLHSTTVGERNGVCAADLIGARTSLTS
jgi:hypothetical protein